MHIILGAKLLPRPFQGPFEVPHTIVVLGIQDRNINDNLIIHVSASKPFSIWFSIAGVLSLHSMPPL